MDSKMEGPLSVPVGDGMDLLEQFEVILEGDKLIDEVGFLHPSQFASLDGESSVASPEQATSVQLADGPETNTEEFNVVQYDKTVFWTENHKLAISTHALSCLYITALHAYTCASSRYKISFDLLPNISTICSEAAEANSDHVLENEILKHTKALLILSWNFGSAWNARRLVLSRKHEISLLLDELHFSKLILSYAPKSDYAWSQRRWVIKMVGDKLQNLQEVIREESELVEKIAEKSKMNYRAWSHRCWLISYMKSAQALYELEKSKRWAELHVADSSCFHYRRKLMLNLLVGDQLKYGEAFNNCQYDVCFLWKEELKWTELLIRRYIGREALWVHRRFLTQCWIKHFATNAEVILDSEDRLVSSTTQTFLAGELQFVKSFLNISYDEFHDTQDQAQYAATYILWILKFSLPQESMYEEIQKELRDMRSILLKTCPMNTCWENLLH